jgi:hypothetical protein
MGSIRAGVPYTPEVETDPASESWVLWFLEYRIIDKAKNLSNSDISFLGVCKHQPLNNF